MRYARFVMSVLAMAAVGATMAGCGAPQPARPSAPAKPSAPARPSALARPSAPAMPSVLARPSDQLVSWNGHITIRPVLATIGMILGPAVNREGGATKAGGWHGGVALADLRQWVNRKVVSGVDQNSLVPPPAMVAGVPVFVQVDDVEIVAMYDNGSTPGTDHDTSANACEVGRPRSNLTCIHIEIDGHWKAKGWAPADFPMWTPIDIQGYLYWGRMKASKGMPLNSAPGGYTKGHYETGWEIHPISAWRLYR